MELSMQNINRTKELENEELSTCDVVDRINELTRHIDGINSLIYISHSAKFDEFDGGIYDGFLYCISIINNSAGRLTEEIKSFFYENGVKNSSLCAFTRK